MLPINHVFVNKPESLKSRHKILSLPWSFVDRAALLVHEQIKQLDVNKILIIARGGAILGVKLSHMLNNRNVCYLQMEKTNSNTPHDYGKIKIKNYPKLTKKDKILIVEDIIYKGDSISKAVSFVKSKNAKVIAVSTLIVDELYLAQPNLLFANSKIPIYSAYFCESNQWIRFPWEVSIKGERVLDE
jgi:xanthine phosphoribosyltransferase